ncbi:MAG: FAD-dependent oxidoreductase [Streptosporangiales bacterium]|nr:FAD-dependent oxidoreductase [Streptosporangiales bacterium]MBO0892511.1 FAD-dependent oxidoreductase [Acidothermales bacterium]
MTARVVVVGGGLAGIAAAVRLADTGAVVTLVEARARLGGATYSFPREGLSYDTGQHVFLRCYDDYRSLLRRLGTETATTIQPRLTMPVLTPGGHRHALRRSGLPAPLHLAGTVLGYGALSRRERLHAVRAATALRGVDPDDPATDAQSFGSWLERHGQSRAAIDRLWGLIAIAALNVHPHDASLALAARVFRTGLLERNDAGDLGIPQAPLGTLHGDAALRVLGDLGADVRLRERVTDIRPGGSGYEVATGDGELSADAVVLAVPHGRAAQLVPPEAADTSAWHQLGASPIVNVHVRYARRVTDLEFFAALDSPLQWVFDRTATSGLHHGQYLAVSLSAADAYLSRPARDVAAEVVDALATLLPDATPDTVRRVYVTREPRATFRPAPGTAALRPSPRTRLPGLALAGAWTDTGLPDTMEGAVRSGYRAADVVACSPHATDGRVTKSTEVPI